MKISAKRHVGRFWWARESTSFEGLYCGKRLWLKVGFYPLDWGWLFERNIINCGPFCLWYMAGPYAAEMPKGMI